MTDDRFADRLDAATYAHDDEIVRVFQRTAEDPDALCLSGKLFHRLTSVASAYRLPILALLGGSDPMTLNSPLCASLLDELAFVAERLNDPLVVAMVQTMSEYVATRAQQSVPQGTITIDGHDS